MKRLFIVVSVLFVLLAGCTPSDGFPIVSAKDVTARLDANDSMVVVIGQTTCGACIEYKPILQELINNYDFNFAYVELDKDNRNDINELVEKHLIQATATPTTYIFIDGELISSQLGFMDYRTTKALLEANGFIE